MEILAEAQRYLEELTSVRDFLAKHALKGTALREGDYTFIGTRWAKLAFRLGPRLTWSPEMWKILEEIAARFDLKIEYGNVVHLKQGLFKREIASIHDIGLENDIAINPSYERGVELLRELSMRLFGASANGPMDRIAVA